MACLRKTSLFFLKKNKPQGDRDYYIAQQNETIYDIAQKNGILLQSLYDYNKISAADNLYPGTKILLRARTAQCHANTQQWQRPGLPEQPVRDDGIKNP